MKENDLEKIERYITGQSDDNEKVWVESLFLNGEDNYTLRHLLEKVWDIMLRDTSHTWVDLSHLLDRVHHIIRKNETLKRQKPLLKFIRIYMKAAAILLLPLLVAGGLVYSYLSNHDKTTTDRPVSSTMPLLAHGYPLIFPMVLLVCSTAVPASAIHFPLPTTGRLNLRAKHGLK